MNTQTITTTCPKCGSPQVEEQTNYAKETGRTWWVCGTFQTRDCHPHYSDWCLEREERKALQCKVDELQDKLDDLQASTIHSCGDSCSRPMCVLRRERDAYKEALEMIAYNCNNPRADYQAVADAALTAIEDMRAKEGEVNVPLEESEGLHEDIIFWLTRAANWTAIAVRMAEELRGYESLALTHPHLYQGKGALLEFDRLKEKMK